MENAAERIDLAARMKWGAGFWLAGCGYWTYAAAIGAIYPFETAKLLWLFGSFAIAPLGFLASWAIGADAQARDNSLARLMTTAHLSAGAMSMPLMFAAFVAFPEALLLIMAICFGIDFFVMAWAYKSPFPAVHAVARTIAVSVIWFSAPGWRSTLLPSTVAFLYLATVIFMAYERPRWLQRYGAA